MVDLMKNEDVALAQKPGVRSADSVLPDLDNQIFPSVKTILASSAQTIWLQICWGLFYFFLF